MTKYMLFKILSVLFIILVLLGICLFETIYVDKSLNVINEFCYQIEENIKENNDVSNKTISGLVGNLTDSWEESESVLCILVNHKTIEQMGVEISKLKVFLSTNKYEDFLESLEVIKHYIIQYKNIMGISFHNIL